MFAKLQEPIKLVIIDDNEQDLIFYNRLFSTMDNFKIVGCYNEPKTAITSLQVNTVDVVLTDVQMPLVDGVTVLHAVKQHHPQTKVIAMTSFANELSFIELVREGIDGFIRKTASPREFEEAIYLALAGKMYVDPADSIHLRHFLNPVSGDSVAELKDQLTSTERRVLSYLLIGTENKEIAQILGISVSTVKKHVSNILHIFKVKNRHQLKEKYNQGK